MFVVPADEEELPKESKPEEDPLEAKAEVTTEISLEKTEPVESLLAEEPAPAAVLVPMQGTDESSELWKSGSAKGEDTPSPAPVDA